MSLVLIRGLPGSGKSTFARSLVRLGWAHYEADMYFMRHGEYLYNPKYVHTAHRWCLEHVAAALPFYENVAVSNTFLRKRELAPYFCLAHRMLKEEPIVITMPNNYGSVHSIPEEKLDRMRRRWCNDISSLYTLSQGNSNGT